MAGGNAKRGWDVGPLVRFMLYGQKSIRQRKGDLLMKYFVNSVCDYIKAQIENHNTKDSTGKAILILPSFPASVLVETVRQRSLIIRKIIQVIL